MASKAKALANLLADGKVGTAELADGSITAVKILDGTISTADMADDAITNPKLADGVVTTDKIAAAAVTADKIADGAVPPSDDASALTQGILPVDRVPYIGRRNLIINGAMQVAQRGTSSTSTGYASVDRWKTVPFRVDTLVGTQSQSTDAPDGFSTSFKYNVDTAESLGGDEYFGVMHHVEAYNVQHLDYGTASAKSMTLSFWVKGSTTGTYAIQFYTEDSGRTIGATYTIDTADTWEYKTVSIVGDTAGSGIANNNGSGFRLFFILASGTNYTTTDNTSWDASSSARIAYNHSANPIATINNYWQITGVQLEVGTVATPFEHRSYGEELDLCYRYFYRWKSDPELYQNICMGNTMGSTACRGVFRLPKTMRSAPTLSSSGSFRVWDNSNANSATPTIQRASNHTIFLQFSGGSFTINRMSEMGADNDANAVIDFYAEL